MQIPKPKRRENLSWLPIVVGLWWLLAEGGGHWLIWSLVPGSILIASGVALLLWPGSPRITNFMALGGLLGVVLMLPALFAHGGTALLCGVGSAACFVAAGRLALAMEPHYADAPAPERSPAIDAKAAMDEALLAYFVSSVHIPAGDEGERMCADALRLDAAIRERGWDRDAALFHRAPPPPDARSEGHRRIYGFEYEQIAWDSGFTLDPELPGAADWQGYTANQGCTLRVLRHPGPSRPWLLCIHGYRMGMPWMDFGLFAPQALHQRLGLNLVLPVLPLHGPRRAGLRSGDHFLDGDVLDLVYAEAQALWDLRRTVAWIRAQEPQARIGVYGVSLGGYNAALLAGYEEQLDFVIAGIPVIDFAAALWRFLPPAHMSYFTSQGIDEARYREILKLVSPLTRPPLVDRSRLLIFAGAADRIVVPHHPVQLGRHWQVPVRWYQGSHLSLRGEPEVRETLREALLRADWPLPPGQAAA